jgi:TonB family protein
MRRITIILFCLLIAIPVVGQEKKKDEKALKLERRFKRLKQDFLNQNYKDVAAYYDSIMKLWNRTGFTTYKMAHYSYQQLSMSQPEQKDSLQMKAQAAYDGALQWYGKMYMDEKWEELKIEVNPKQVPIRKIDKGPEYPGGIQEFYKYIATNVQYPEEAKELGVEGKVQVQFMLNKDGSIDAVNVIRGIGKGCDEEAVRVVKNAQKFSPGMSNGEPQFIRMSIPVVFKLVSSYESKKEKRRNRRKKRKRN